MSLFKGKNAPMAQLDRASGYGPEGWGFESSWAYTSTLRYDVQALIHFV